jgi:hypothetical protein
VSASTIRGQSSPDADSDDHVIRRAQPGTSIQSHQKRPSSTGRSSAGTRTAWDSGPAPPPTRSSTSRVRIRSWVGRECG